MHSKAKLRRMRRKACNAAYSRAQQASLDSWLAANAPVMPLISSLVPVHTFKVQVRDTPHGCNPNLSYQNFACMPASEGRVTLCTWPQRGARNVGQWPFDNASQAEAWAHQYFGFSGCAVRA